MPESISFLRIPISQLLEWILVRTSQVHFEQENPEKFGLKNF